MTREAVAVHVWHTPRHDGYETDYSVSVVDDDGHEIRCAGGENSLRAAMAYARMVARDIGLRPRLDVVCEVRR